MPENPIQIYGHHENRFRIEPTEIPAELGVDYPRLIIPIQMDFTPMPRDDTIEYEIISIQCRLYYSDHSALLSDSLPEYPIRRVRNSNERIGANIEFPLDRFRVAALESRRTGSAKFRFQCNLVCALYENQSHRSHTAQTQVDFEIPQSHWVEHILPDLGYGKYFIVEIPTGKSDLEQAWKLIEDADRSFGTWNVKGLYGYCREVGQLLNGIHGQNEGWRRAYKHFNHLASLGLHVEDIKRNDADLDVGMADSEYLLIVTKALMKYAESLGR